MAIDVLIGPEDLIREIPGWSTHFSLAHNNAGPTVILGTLDSLTGDAHITYHATELVVCSDAGNNGPQTPQSVGYTY